MQQQRHEHQRRDGLGHNVTPGELGPAVAAAPVGSQIADHRDQVPHRQHVTAGVAMGPATQHALPMDDAPGCTVQKAAHARTQQGGQQAAVNS